MTRNTPATAAIAFAALVTAGCACLAANKAELNKINVFPIPDGDTGTNMAMACRGIVKGVRKATSDTLGDVAGGLRHFLLESGVPEASLFVQVWLRRSETTRKPMGRGRAST